MTSAPELRLSADVGLLAMLEDGSFLLAALGDGVPDTVEVRPNGDARLAWNAAAVSWPLIGATEYASSGFVVLFPLPARERAGLQSIMLRTPHAAIALDLPRAPCSLDTLFAVVAAEAGPSYGKVVDGLVEILLAAEAGPARARAAAKLLATAAKSTGYIEIVGAATREEFFVQGWATDLAAGATPVLAVGDPPVAAQLACATFERQDLAGRGRGFAGVIDPAPFAEPESLKHLFFRADDGWRKVEIYERRTSLGTRDVPGHLRALLAQAVAPPDTMARLRRTAHRFDGRETVSQAREPVRLGIDLAVSAPGSGILVAGWLLDPHDSVRAVRLCAGVESVVISADWTRLPRDDVANAFASDPNFRGFVTGRPLAGFVAFAPRVSAVDGETRLELDLGDGEPFCYFPIEVSRAPLDDALANLLAAVDLRSAAADSAVERQLVPMLGAMSKGQPTPLSVSKVGAPLPKDAQLALVIGADRRAADTTSLLAILAADRHVRDLPIVFAAPGDALRAIAGEIARLATFYDLSVELAECERGATTFDALVAGAAAATAPTVVLLSADTLPLTVDWLPRLLAAYRLRGERHVVCPTILFEDRSVRWGGAWFDEDDGRQRLTTPNLGLPADAVIVVEPQKVSAGTLECCILPRAAIAEIGDTPGTLLGSAARNLDLALQLRQRGTPALWVPDVLMVAAGDGAGGAAPMARRIDERLLDTRWSPATSSTRR
jgi:hypothetical protein